MKDLYRTQEKVSWERGSCTLSFLLLYGLIFLYFVTLCADLLHVQFYLFKPKINHLLALLVFSSFFLVKKTLLLPKEIFWIFISLLFSIAISSLFSPLLSRSLGYIAIYLFNFVFFFLLPMNLVYQLDERKIFKLYFSSFICVGLYALAQLILSFFGILDPLLTQFINQYARPHAFAYEPSFYALYISAYVMFWNAFFLFQTPSGSRIMQGLKLLFVNSLLLISTSTGGFFAYFILLFTIVFLSHYRPLHLNFPELKKRLLSFVGVFASLIALIALFLPQIAIDYFFKFFYHGFMSHGCFSARWEGIERCWETFLENPLFGVGIGGVGPHFYEQYFGFLPAGGTISLEEVELFDPTNVLTEILASLGICGLIIFLFLIYRYWKLFKKTVSNPLLEERQKIFAVALFISLIVVILELQFNQGLFRSYIWTHAALTYGYLYKLSARRCSSS